MERVCLINPPSPFLLDERVFPYLGLLYVATAMQMSGQPVKVMDLSGRKDYLEEVNKQIDNFDIFGITSTSSQFQYAYKIMHTIKQKYNKKVAIGGPHATAMFSLKKRRIRDHNLKTLSEFDIIIAGDGETGFREMFKEGPKFRQSQMIDSNAIGIPSRDFYDIDSYYYELNNKKATTILTQRGCPFKCNFCAGRTIDEYRKSRQNSPELVKNEMEYLNILGYDAFMWFDDELNINPNRLKKINGLIGNKYKHRGFLSSDLLVKYPKSLDYLADMGFVELCIGVESGSNEILNRIGKGTTTEINTKAVKMIKEKGIGIKAFTMVGHPGETYNDVMKTKQWLKKNKPDIFDIGLLQPYPSSIMYDEAVPSTKYKGFPFEWKGLYFKKPDYSKDTLFHKGTPGTYQCYTRTDKLNSEDFIKLREEIECELT